MTETPSAWQLAQEMGDELPNPEDLPPEASELTKAARSLVEAVVAADIDASTGRALAHRIDDIELQLRATPRDPLPLLGRHPSGRIENLTQAGSGRLNPHALPLVFDPVAPAHSGSTPAPVEVIGRCTLGDQHGGPPDRAHGGVVATLLDEAIGLATVLAGAPGLTAGMTIRYRAGTPLHTPLVVRARYDRSEGHKHIATGEVRLAGPTPDHESSSASGEAPPVASRRGSRERSVTAEAEGIFIAPDEGASATG